MRALVFQTSAPDDLFKEGASSRCEKAHQHMLVAGPSDKHGKQRGHSLFGLDGNTSFISYYRISSRGLLPGRLKCSTIGSMNDAGSP
jgi:hypothetical protein